MALLKELVAACSDTSSSSSDVFFFLLSMHFSLQTVKLLIGRLDPATVFGSCETTTKVHFTKG